MSRAAAKNRVRVRKDRAYYTDDARSQWKPKRQRKPSKRPKRPKGIGFAYELGMLKHGANLVAVMCSAFGESDAGRLWQADMRALLETLPTLHTRRCVLQHFLRWFSGAVMHGSRWRVVDAAGYVGRQHELRIDPKTGKPEINPKTGKPRRFHFPGKLPGTLAAADDKLPRQLNRYRRHLRGADRSTARGKSTARGLVGCEQPAFWDSDAVVPHTEGSTWAYGQAWLLRPPSPEMVRRWVADAPADAPAATTRAQVAQHGLPSEPDALAHMLYELRAEDLY